jgi:hypothetical protein
MRPVGRAENYVSSSARSPMRPSAARALLTAMNELEQQWARAIEVATDALEAIARAQALPPEEIRARRQRLALELTWLATVDWPRFGSSRGTTVTALEAPSEVVRPRLRSAA